MSGMERILERYGQSVTLKNKDGEQEIRAFLQPEKARTETVPGSLFIPMSLKQQRHQKPMSL